jgi:hypothetical protein
MNDAKGVKNFDSELKAIVDYIWDNEPRLSKEQNEKGSKFLKNLAFMANGKARSNSPFGSREEYSVKNFAYMKLRGFHDVSTYGQPERYVPLFTVYDDEGYGFEYFYHAGKINVVGEKGMSIKKKGKLDVDFFDSDKKVQDFLNLSKVQFMARYKETKDRYQQMVNAITRNIEGVFMHGGKMGGAGQFGEGGKLYYTMNNVGKSKYVINYHDGSKTHKDGSAFYDIDIYNNKKDFDKAVAKLESEGYKYRYEDGGYMATGGLTNIKGTTEPKAYPQAEPNTNVVV